MTSVSAEGLTERQVRDHVADFLQAHAYDIVDSMLAALDSVHWKIAPCATFDDRDRIVQQAKEIERLTARAEELALAVIEARNLGIDMERVRREREVRGHTLVVSLPVMESVPADAPYTTPPGVPAVDEGNDQP